MSVNHNFCVYDNLLFLSFTHREFCQTNLKKTLHASAMIHLLQKLMVQMHWLFYFNSSQNDTKALQGCRNWLPQLTNLSFLIVAVDKLPNFLVRPSKDNGEASDHHRCTIHINTESMAIIEKAYTDCLQGRPSDR